jgi:hypothetical protein
MQVKQRGPGDRRKLGRMVEAEREAIQRDRLRCVGLALDRYETLDIAATLGRRCRFVPRWVHAHRIRGRCRAWRDGYRPCLTPAQEARSVERVRRGATPEDGASSLRGGTCVGSSPGKLRLRRASPNPPKRDCGGGASRPHRPFPKTRDSMSRVGTVVVSLLGGGRRSGVHAQPRAPGWRRSSRPRGPSDPKTRIAARKGRRTGDARPRSVGFDTSEPARKETKSVPRGGVQRPARSCLTDRRRPERLGEGLQRGGRSRRFPNESSMQPDDAGGRVRASKSRSIRQNRT